MSQDMNMVYETLQVLYELNRTTLNDEVLPENKKTHDTHREGMMACLTEHLYQEAYRQDQDANAMHDSFLKYTISDLIEKFFEDVDFQTLRYDDEVLSMIHMMDMADDVSRAFAHGNLNPDQATDILREYGLDQAMNRYGHEAIRDTTCANENSNDPTRKRFTGFSNELACLVITEYTRACAVYIYQQIREVVELPDDSEDEDSDEEEVQRSYLAELLVEGNIENFGHKEGECAICSDTVEPCFTLPCKHAFGLTCLSAWTKKQVETGDPNTCPMCRAPY